MIRWPKNFPDKPGVYFFKKGKSILYIGKATSLRDRVRSYFNKDLIDTRGALLVKMLEETKSVEYKVTDSVLEALILEAELIKKYQPFYNKQEKDDKSWNYVVITDEDFPRVLVVRGKELLSGATAQERTYRYKNTFGPFPHGPELKEALKIVRKIFPFRDKCMPANPGGETAEKKQLKSCFNAQIGLCPGVCSGEMSKNEYAKVIRSIILFFKGKKQEILRGLHKHMRQAVVAREFEKAIDFRNKIFALTHINDVALLKRSKPIIKHLATRRPSGEGVRIEAYDIAHISGTNTVGAMVVMENGELAKHEYKRFKLRGLAKNKNDDIANLTELLERRFKHYEWPTPDLIVIDGGVAQLNVARLVMSNPPASRAGLQLEICKPEIVSVIKNDKHKPDRILGDSAIVRDYHHDILLANAEAHRFALVYHRLLRGKLI